jgi:hypothetical protein
MGWTVQESNPGGGENSASVLTGSGTYPTTCTTVTGSFPGTKRPGRGVYHPPPLAPMLRKSRAIHLLLLCAFTAGYWLKYTFAFIFVRRVHFVDYSVDGRKILTYTYIKRTALAGNI